MKMGLGLGLTKNKKGGSNGPTIATSPVISGDATGEGNTLTLTTAPVWTGATSSSYVWQRNGVDIVGSTNSTTVVVQVGENTGTYRVKATGTNAEDSTIAYSNTLTGVVLATIGTVPTQSFNWTDTLTVDLSAYVTDNGGDAALVYAATGAGVSSVNTSTGVVTMSQAVGTTSVSWSVTNDAGEQTGTAFNVTISAEAPAQVTGLTATPGDTQVSLSWSAPASNGSAIWDYLIEVNIAAGGWTTVPDGVGTGTTYVHTGLTNGSEHVYRVSAINGVGSGTASATASATPSAGATTDPNLTAINAEGWAGTYTSPPTFDPVSNPKYAVVTRQGFDNTGSATTFDENVIITQRVRQPYPNEASLTTSDVALSEPVYAGDTITGVTNNSTLVAPKPVCAFSRPDHEMVGDSIEVAVVAFSGMPKDGEPVAAVVFSATDGTTTVTTTVTSCEVSTWGVSDYGGKVLEYVGTLDVSTLNDDAKVTVNAKVYPHVGAAYADSSRNNDHSGTEGDNRMWHPQIFWRDTTHTPIYAYVDATSGNDGTGVTSTTAATAKASPYQTIAAAVLGIRTADGARTDGHVVRLMAGTHAEWGGAVTALTGDAWLTIERDPDTTRANVILQSTSATDILDSDFLKFSGITMQRTGANQFNIPVGNASPSNSAYAIAWVHDCAIDNNSHTGAERFFSTSFYAYWTQNEVSNVGDLLDDQGAVYQFHRGNDYLDLPANAEVGPTFIGNYIRNLDQASGYLRLLFQDGACFAFNRFEKGDFPQLYWVTNDATPYGTAVVQNLFEHIGPNERGIQYAAESTTPNVMNNQIWLHNTVAGQGTVGRVNIFYDDDAGSVHNFTNLFLRNNDFGQLNIKTDTFAANAANVGNWEVIYGSGSGGNVTESSLTFNQEYPGMNSSIPAASSRQTRYYTNYQAVTWDGASTYTAGTGGGDYSLGASDPGYRAVPRALPFDLDGNARSATTDAGCFQS